MTIKANPTGLIARSSWGAKSPDGFDDRPLPISEWWLHHSVTIAPDLVPPFSDDDAAIRTLEEIGQARFGGGISYTIPITPVGRAYVGHSFWRRGAHTKDHNTVAAAVCFVGDYTTRKPTTAMLHAAALVMVNAHRQGLAKTHRLNGGHRDVYGTSCPGDAAYACISQINQLAQQLWDGTAQEDTMALTIEDAREVWSRNAVVKDVRTASPTDDWCSPSALLEYSAQKAREHDAKLAGLASDIASLKAAVAALSSSGAAIDTAALADKIADTLAARLGS